MEDREGGQVQAKKTGLRMKAADTLASGFYSLEL